MTRPWHPDAAEPRLQALATTEHLLIALDFDGTVAPLVDRPMSARALPAMRAEVQRLASLPKTIVAFVSGRSLDDLRIIAEHDDDSPIALAASHGAQFWFPAEGERMPHEDDPAERAGLVAAAAAAVTGLDGIWVESKAHGFGIHTRLAAPDAAARAVAAVDTLMAARAPGWRRRAGHDILEFSSRWEGKDTALAALRERFAATAVLFAGDDVTDEDALAALDPGDLGIRVGEGPTAAALRVEGPEQLAALLATVRAERAA